MIFDALGQRGPNSGLRRPCHLNLATMLKQAGGELYYMLGDPAIRRLEDLQGAGSTPRARAPTPTMGLRGGKGEGMLPGSVVQTSPE